MTTVHNSQYITIYLINFKKCGIRVCQEYVVENIFSPKLGFLRLLLFYSINSQYRSQKCIFKNSITKRHACLCRSSFKRNVSLKFLLIHIFKDMALRIYIFFSTAPRLIDTNKKNVKLV